MTDPFKPDPQEWERLRQQVADLGRASDTINLQEQRMRNMETRLNQLEVVTAKELQALVSNYQNVSMNIEKLVTRFEFDPIRLLTYGLAGGFLLVVVGFILSRVFVK